MFPTEGRGNTKLLGEVGNPANVAVAWSGTERCERKSGTIEEPECYVPKGLRGLVFLFHPRCNERRSVVCAKNHTDPAMRNGCGGMRAGRGGQQDAQP